MAEMPPSGKLTHDSRPTNMEWGLDNTSVTGVLNLSCATDRFERRAKLKDPFFSDVPRKFFRGEVKKFS
jgi:hypothetical protein